MPEIAKPKQLEDWLQDKPPIVSQAIAVRILFRTLPCLEPRLNRPNAVLLYFRALYVMWVACRYPGKVTGDTIRQTLESIEFLTRDGDRDFQNFRSKGESLYATDAALRMVLRRALQTHLYMGTNYVGSAADAFSYSRDAAPAHVLELSTEIENDIMWLESNADLDVAELTQTFVSGSFWSPAGALRGAWLKLKERLRDETPDFDVWFGWFDFRASGTPAIWSLDPSFDLPLAETIANEHAAYWQGDADVVCQRIKKQINDARTAQTAQGVNYISIRPQSSASELRIAEQILASSAVSAGEVDGKLSPVQGPSGLMVIGDESGYYRHLQAQRALSGMVADDCEKEQLPHATVRLFRRYATVLHESEIIWFLADDLMSVIAEVQPNVSMGWSQHASGYVRSLVNRHDQLKSYLQRRDGLDCSLPQLVDLPPEVGNEISAEIRIILTDPAATDELSESGALFLGYIAEKVKSADAAQVSSAIQALAGFVVGATEMLNKFGEKHKGIATIVGAMMSLAALLLKLFGKG